MERAENSEYVIPIYGAHARIQPQGIRNCIMMIDRQHFSATGYKYCVDSMCLINVPLLSNMIQANRVALKLE